METWQSGLLHRSWKPTNINVFREFKSHRFRQTIMTVQFRYVTIVRDADSRLKRNAWLYERIPTQEYFIQTDTTAAYEYGVDMDDFIETIVTIWHNDAEKIATEFWFQFP